MNTISIKAENAISTGVKGLDDILFGGFLPQKAYLLRGGPGTGKSSLGYKFLEHGSKSGENTLLITLSESKESAVSNACSMKIDLSKVSILDLSPEEQIYTQAHTYDVFPAGDVESAPLIESIVEKIEEVRPSRVLLDSVSMLKYLHQDPYQFRNMIISFIRYTCNSGATVILISETSNPEKNDKVAFWVDGIIDLEYAPTWRKISVSKFRGSGFRSGNHTFKLTSEGPEVFPKLRPNSYSRWFENRTLPTGSEDIDKMLGGGIEKGTTTLITGPTGVGKTSLGLQFIKQASLRGEKSVIYTFEEAAEIILRRSKGINIDLEESIKSGMLRIVPIEPLSYSPDEFASMMRHDIEEYDTSVVMVDSIGGYSLSVRDEKPIQRLHSLGVYLQNMGVTGLFINEVQGVTGEFISTEMNASYLSDNILFIKYLELNGELQKIMGVLKKRLSGFERCIREFEITSEGLKVGKPLKGYQGLLNGTPYEH